MYNTSYDLTFRTNTAFLQHEPNASGARGYAYSNILFSDSLLWTIAGSYDYSRQGPLLSRPAGHEQLQRNQLNPKTGIQAAIYDNVLIRAAIFRNSRTFSFVHRSIEPTQLAGFNQSFDDPLGTESWTYGAGLDARISKSFYAGTEFLWRQLGVPFFSIARGRWHTQNWHETLYSAYFYWLLSNEFALNSNPIVENFRSGSSSNPRVQTTTVPITLRYFGPSGIFAAAGINFVHQDVRRKGGNDGNEDFLTFDAGIGYRLPFRRGIVGLEGRNLSNEKFRYQDTNFRTFGTGAPFLTQCLPERMILLTLNVNF